MKVIYVCNAYDPITREKDRITSDSPAAFVKVFNVLNGLRKNGIDVLLYSINMANRAFCSGGECKYNDVSIYYLKNVKFKLIRNLFVFFKLPIELIKQKADIYIFYNYSFEYLIAFFLLFLFKRKCVLDIEDDVNNELPVLKKIIRKLLVKLYINFSSGKIITVNKAIVAAHKQIKKSFICYGAGVFYKKEKRVPKNILCTGSLLKETGMDLIINLYKDNRCKEFLEKNYKFNVCGFGPYEKDLKEIDAKGYSFLGKVNDKTYKKLLFESDIALVLKDPDSSMGQTTFPSKVVEYSLNDLAIICTPVSDIPELFSENEVYYVKTYLDIINVLEKISNSYEEFIEKKKLQTEIAVSIFEDEVVGKKLKKFLLS